MLKGPSASRYKMIHLLSASLPLFAIVAACSPSWQNLEYDSSRAAVDNPLKGFMPYVGAYEFPHSLEYFYIGMAEIVAGPAQYDWDEKLEPTLNSVASRGHQAVFGSTWSIHGAPCRCRSSSSMRASKSHPTNPMGEAVRPISMIRCSCAPYWSSSPSSACTTMSSPARRARNG